MYRARNGPYAHRVLRFMESLLFQLKKILAIEMKLLFHQWRQVWIMKTLEVI